MSKQAETSKVSKTSTPAQESSAHDCQWSHTIYTGCAKRNPAHADVIWEDQKPCLNHGMANALCCPATPRLLRSTEKCPQCQERDKYEAVYRSSRRRKTCLHTRLEGENARIALLKCRDHKGGDETCEDEVLEANKAYVVRDGWYMECDRMDADSEGEEAGGAGVKEKSNATKEAQVLAPQGSRCQWVLTHYFGCLFEHIGHQYVGWESKSRCDKHLIGDDNCFPATATHKMDSEGRCFRCRPGGPPMCLTIVTVGCIHSKEETEKVNCDNADNHKAGNECYRSIKGYKDDCKACTEQERRIDKWRRGIEESQDWKMEEGSLVLEGEANKEV